MTFYKDRFNVWRKGYDFFNLANIFAGAFPGKLCSEDVFEKFFVDCGAITEIKRFQDEPDVIDYIKMGMKLDALARYQEIHGVGPKEALHEVAEMIKNMED